MTVGVATQLPLMRLQKHLASPMAHVDAAASCSTADNTKAVHNIALDRCMVAERRDCLHAAMDHPVSRTGLAVLETFPRNNYDLIEIHWQDLQQRCGRQVTPSTVQSTCCMLQKELRWLKPGIPLTGLQYCFSFECRPSSCIEHVHGISNSTACASLAGQPGSQRFLFLSWHTCHHP